jgi:hypothetical protein
VPYAFKTKFAAEFFEVEVVALGQRVRHVHAEAGKLDRSVARNKTLRKRGQCYGKLDGGAGFSSRRERQLLVDHRQNASIGGVDHDGCAVHAAQGVDCGLANYRIFAGGDVALKDIALGKGTRGEPFKETMAAMGKDSTAQSWRRRGCDRTPTSCRRRRATTRLG